MATVNTKATLIQRGKSGGGSSGSEGGGSEGGGSEGGGSSDNNAHSQDFGSNASPPPSPSSNTATLRFRGDRREAFKHYAEHYSETFRSDLYQHEEPRQILLLSIGVGLLAYFGLTRTTTEEGDPRADTHAAILGLVIMFSVYCATQVRDTLMVRPHPMLWRVVHGFAVLYLCLLCVLFMQSVDGARSLIRLIAPQAIDEFKPADPFAVPNVSIFAFWKGGGVI